MVAVMITEPIAKKAIDELVQRGYTVTTEYGDPAFGPCPPEEVEAVINRTRPITREWMAQYPNLKIVAYHGVGIDAVDLEAAKERGIYVTITPGQNSLSVAELTMALILGLAKQLPRIVKGYREEGFDCKYTMRFTEISDKTLGLIGMGNIGMRVANMARLGFGMRILAYDPLLKEQPEGIEVTDDRMRVFKEADYVSLHLPLNDSTRKSVGTAEFAAMKPSAFLINCARGAIVDEQALISALKSGMIGGAGLDVTDPERCHPDNPLLSMPNVIVTPHIAASSEEALIRVAMMNVESIADALAGREPRGRVV